MSIDRIPVVVEHAAGALTGNAVAVLREVAGYLTELAEGGGGGIIDLAAMPLSPADKAWLATQLGEGEVTVTLSLDGPSDVRETGFAGVWWLLHRNPEGVVTGEFIEVCRVPELVMAPLDDIISGSERLNFLMGDLC